MFNKKRAIATLAASGLLAATILSGTLAYLTDSEAATNTFTVGNVKIDLVDEKWPGNDSDTIKNAYAYLAVESQPKIKNTGSSDAIVFMTVDLPVGTVINDDGVKEQAALACFKDGDHHGTHPTYGGGLISYLYDTNNYVYGGWIELTNAETSNTNGTERHVFGYKYKLKADETTGQIYSWAMIKNIGNDVDPAEALDIDVKAYAIQSSHIDLYDGFDPDNKELTQSDLETIYQMYIDQEGSDSIDADGNNNFNYDGSAVN